MGEFEHLGDVEARQVANPVDHRLRRQGLRRGQAAQTAIEDQDQPRA